MFSNISEAWSNDPVKEMSNKLSNGGFPEHTQRAEIYQFKNSDIKNKSNDKNKNKIDIDDISLSNNSISLTDGFFNKKFKSNYSGPAPVNFRKGDSKRINAFNDYDLSDDNLADTDYNLKCGHGTKCNYRVNHLNNCDRCYKKLKKMIDSKVEKKFNEMILEDKLKQLQQQILTLPNNQLNPSSQPNPASQPNPTSQLINTNNWKEILIIVIGLIVVMLVIFLTVKIISKKS